MSSSDTGTSISARLRLPGEMSTEELGSSTSGSFALSDAPGAHDDLPVRYEVRRREESCVLLCGEAPGVAVSIKREYAFSEAEARKLGERVILLDGAGQFAPLIDDACNLYNLDHHRDCLRAFTLATCEQALILVLKGLRLDKGDWTVYANEPDLDTLFSLWVLLNYRRVRELSPAQRDAIIPLLRLEGAIDANGFEIAEHCGLPQERLKREKARLDALHKLELEIKAAGDWGTMDLAEYARDMLLAIDRYVYKASDFSDYSSVEEIYGHVDVASDHVAVVCRDGAGIYEVERRLKKMWGDRLGIVALEKDAGHYTLRRTASFAGIELDAAYDKLNLLDPQVDGRPPDKRWGGSDEIGGSPRPTGTALTPREIGNILKMTYQEVSRWQRAQRLAVATLWTAGLFLAAVVAVFAWRRFIGSPEGPREHAEALALAGGVLGLGGWVLTRKLSSGWTWLFGWRRPTGYEGWLLALPALVAAALGGGWVPVSVAAKTELLALGGVSTGIASVALGLTFASMVHGLLVLDSPVQGPGTRWFLSRPALASGVLYALVTTGASHLWIAPVALAGADFWPRTATTAGLALVVGLALAMSRERSLSLWPGVVTLFVGSLIRIVLLL